MASSSIFSLSLSFLFFFATLNLILAAAAASVSTLSPSPAATLTSPNISSFFPTPITTLPSPPAASPLSVASSGEFVGTIKSGSGAQLLRTTIALFDLWLFFLLLVLSVSVV
ncbi:hypothetical protein LguiA_019769 [Lonicera macranthoides]